MTSVCCFLCAGRDAAGASAPRRPQDEEGGGHGPGLRQRDHDPHALPSERDHHLHVQTGTAHRPVVFITPVSKIRDVEIDLKQVKVHTQAGHKKLKKKQDKGLF